jgi:hypothetical protein
MVPRKALGSNPLFKTPEAIAAASGASQRGVHRANLAPHSKENRMSRTELTEDRRPLRDKAREAGEFFGSLADDLEAARDRNQTLSAQLHVALSINDEKDRRIFQLEEEAKLHLIEREAFITEIRAARSAIERADHNIHNSVLNDTERRQRPEPAPAGGRLTDERRKAILEGLHREFPEGRTQPARIEEQQDLDIPAFMRRGPATAEERQDAK